ncbi:MAG: hypothetical protein WAV20_19115 [Blastocatellia bacterium]
MPLAITTQAQTLVVKKQIVDRLIAMERLTQAEVKECGGVNKIIYSLQNIDLNKDGKPEFIADFNCAGNFEFWVCRKTANGIDIIYEGGEREGITPLKTYTNGWRNLRSTSWSAGTGESGSVTLRWNGREYK